MRKMVWRLDSAQNHSADATWGGAEWRIVTHPSVCRSKSTRSRYQHPSAADVGLVVEVADTSLDADREMAQVYGASGVPIYWIVNVREYLIEVFAEPTSDGYGSKREYKPGEDVPVVLDGAEVGRIAISDLLR